MEKRNIKIDLITAKNWYNKGGELKEISLQAFTEDELTRVELPKTWKEYCENYPRKIGECYTNSGSNILTTTQVRYRDADTDKNLLPSEEAAEAHLALIQLHQLRDCYRQGWVPKYNNYSEIWIIAYSYDTYLVYKTCCNREFLSFQSKEIAEEFFNNFKDLIIKAGDLI